MDAIAKDSSEAGLAAMEAFKRADEAADDLRDGMLAAKEAVDALARGEVELGVAEAAVTKASDLLFAAQWRLRDAFEAARNAGVEAAAVDADLAKGEAEVAAAATVEAAAIGDAVTAKVKEAVTAKTAADADKGLALASMGAAAAQRFLAAAARDSGGAFNDADRALADTARAAMAATGFWARWGNVIHWVISGSIEFLAVAIPAMIAFGAAMLVGVQGAQNLQIHLQSLWTAAEATGNMFHQTMGTMLGLKSVLQQAQNAADPKIYALLGAGLGIVREQAGGLVKAGSQVITVFDEFAAKLRYDFSSAGGAGRTMGAVLHAMVPDLVEFGQVFGNLGHAVANFASKMPGLAELLLKILDVASRLILVVSNLPTPLIMAAMGMEEIYRWGQPLAAILTKLPTLLAAFTASGFGVIPVVGRIGEVLKATLSFLPNFVAEFSQIAAIIAPSGSAFESAALGVNSFAEGISKAIGSMKPFTAGLLGLAVAGFVALAVAISHVKDSAEQMAAKMTDAVRSASDTTVIGTAIANFNDLAMAASRTQASLQRSGTAAQQFGAVVNSGIFRFTPLLQGLGGASLITHSFAQNLDNGRQIIASAIPSFGGLAASAVHLWASFTGAATAAHDTQALTQAQQEQLAALKNTMNGAALLAHTYGTSFVGALMLAQQAGVKLQNGITGTGEAAVVARLQVADYVQGWQAMGQPLGEVGADMTALSISASLQASKVGQLNQAWDQFMQNLTGGTAGLAGFENSLTNMMNKTASAKQNLASYAGQINLTTSSFANSLKSYTGKGAAAWQNFDQVVGQTAPQLIDWFRTAGAEGAVSGKQFSSAVQGMVAQLYQVASKAPAARAELLGLAQQGDSSITTWKALTAWVKNDHETMGQWQKGVTEATQKMADMGQVAQNLGSVMSSQITSALDSAKVSASGLTQEAENLTQGLQSTNTPASTLISNALTMRGTLERLIGTKSGADQFLHAWLDSFGQTGKALWALVQNAQSNGPKIPQSLKDAATHGGPSVADAYAHMARSTASAFDAVNLPGHMQQKGEQSSSQFLHGLDSKSTEIDNWAKQVNTSVKGELNHLPPAATAAGKDAGAGLVAGMRSEQGAVAAEAAALANAASAAIKHALQSHSPSLVTMRIGQDAAQGLAIGMTNGLPAVQKAAELLGHIIPGGVNQGMGGGPGNQGLAGNAMQKIGKETIFQLITGMMGSVSQIKAAMKVITDAMKGAMSGFGHGGLVGWNDQALLDSIKAGNQQLLALAKQRDKIAAEIKAATQYAAQVSSNLISSTGLAGVQQPTDPKTGKNLPWTPENIQSQMTTQLNQLQAFDHNIDVLRKMGLNKTLLNQIIQAGYQQGGALAQALAHGSAAQIKSLNATEEAIIKASKKIGNDAANAMYDTGKNAGKGFLSGLKSQEAAIEKLMEQIAEKMIKALEKALKIKSPSQEMYARGMLAAQGLAKGLLDGEPIVIAAAKRLAAAVSQVKVAPPRVVGPLRPGGQVIQIAPGTPPAGVSQPIVVVHQHIAGSVLSEQQLQQYVQTAQLKYTHRNLGNGLFLPGRASGTPAR